ncbi:MAG: hypothetical protein ACQESU_06205, partial [Halobacteriota archaeon]
MKDEIESKVGFNEIEINKYRNLALNIAKELDSLYWEGNIRMQIAESNTPYDGDECLNLRIARNIFAKLQQREFV